MSATKVLAATHPSNITRKPTGASRQIYGLDLIRFAAAMLVVLHHLAFWSWVRKGIPVHFYYLGPYTWSGWVGVHIFFVLSGFIIAYSAEKATPADFVRSRLVRLYPAAWVCSTCTLLMLTVSRTARLDTGLLLTWLNSFFLVPHSRWIDGSYWTLLIEISFYALVFALLAVRGFRYLGAVMGTVGVLSTAVNLYKFAAEHGFFGASTAGALYWRYEAFAASGWSNRLLMEHGCLFAIGALLWLCLFKRMTLARMAIILVCIAGAIVNIDGESAYFMHEAHANYSYATPLLLWLTALLCIVLSVRYNHAAGEVLGAHGAAVARRLGLITYPLYLVHQVNGFILMRAYLHTMPDFMALILTVLTVLGASWAISVLLETPLQRWLRGVLGASRKLPLRPAATLP